MKRIIVALFFALGACEPPATVGLPFTREETATGAGEVKSNTVNAMQDAITAEHNKPIHFGAGSWQFDEGTLSNPDDDTLNAAGAFDAWLDITPWLIPGDTIKEIVWRYFNGATPTAGTVRFFVKRIPVASSDAPVIVYDSGAGTYNTNTGGADAMRNQLTAIAHVVLADHFYSLRVVFDATAGGDAAGLRGATVVLGL